MYPPQQWVPGQPPPPPPPQQAIVVNPFVVASGGALPAPATIYISSSPSEFKASTTIDHAFARSGRDLSIASGVFSLLASIVAMVACAGPWVSFPVAGSGGALLPVQDCSNSFGLVYWGRYGPSCPASEEPRWGTRTVAEFCRLPTQTCTVVPAQLALALLSLAAILSSVATASSFVACGRYARAPTTEVTSLHFGTAQVQVALSATAFTLSAVGVAIASGWFEALLASANAVYGGGSVGGDAAIGCSLVAMVLAIVLKFKTRGLARASGAELCVQRRACPLLPSSCAVRLTRTLHSNTHHSILNSQCGAGGESAGRALAQVLLLLGLLLALLRCCGRAKVIHTGSIYFSASSPPPLSHRHSGSVKE